MKMYSKKQIVGFLHQMAETMEIPPHRLAAAALEYANRVFGDADELGNAGATEDEPFHVEGKAVDTDLPATLPLQPYTGPIHLCLDFGTAMSKAFAWDKNSDDPMPLRIGHAAGAPASSPYVLDSTIFISRDGRVFFGQEAVNRAAAVDSEHHQAFQSIKDILTVGPISDLRESVSSPYNPGGHPVSRREVVTLYLAFLTDSALLALREDYREGGRNIPRNYTKPVFDPERDEWATEILTECATVGQALADRFSGQWDGGIPLDDLRKVIAEPNMAQEHLVVERSILPEPVAAFAGRIRNVEPERHRRRLMMVIDAGAGTTDFAMFARVEHEDQMSLFRIRNSVATVRIAGNDVDSALMDYLLRQAGVTESDPRLGAIRADLQRDIRLLKEELFRKGSVTRQLVNDRRAEARLDDFEACSAMVRLRDAMQEAFNKVLSRVDSSWLSFRDLEVFFTGGGASLGMVTRLARNQPVRIGNSVVTPIPVTQPPPWLEDECEDVVGFYPQLAVCIGGACHGAGKTDLGVDRELQEFGGDLPDVQWTAGGFRDGQ